jgi:hypothetical protein
MIGLVPRTRPTVKPLAFDSRRMLVGEVCDRQALIEVIAAHLRKHWSWRASLQNAYSIGATPVSVAKAMGGKRACATSAGTGNATRTREATDPIKHARRLAPAFADLIGTPLRTVRRA